MIFQVRYSNVFIGKVVDSEHIGVSKCHYKDAVYWKFDELLADVTTWSTLHSYYSC